MSIKKIDIKNEYIADDLNEILGYDDRDTTSLANIPQDIARDFNMQPGRKEEVTIEIHNDGFPDLVKRFENVPFHAPERNENPEKILFTATDKKYADLRDILEKKTAVKVVIYTTRGR